MLPWWIQTLMGRSERSVLTHRHRPIVVYVGASGFGHIGSSIFLDGQRYEFCTHVPEWMRSEDSGIYELETRASLSGLSRASEMVPGRKLILCGDNRGASHALVRGACRAELGSLLRGTFWAMAAAYSCPVWISEALGRLNPADDPSRDRPAFTAPKTAVWKRCEAPLCFARARHSKKISNSQFF